MLYILPFILEFLCFYTTLHGFLEISKKPKKNDIILFVLFIFISILSSKYSITAWVLGQIFYCAFTLTYNNKSFINSLLLYIISYCTIVLSQLCIVFIMQFFNVSYDQKYMPCVGSACTLIFLIIVFQFTKYRRIYFTLTKTVFLFKILIINTYIVVSGILLLLKINSANFYNNITAIISFLAILIAFNSCLLFYEQRLNFEKQKVLSYEENLPLYQSLIDEIRSNQHEFSNRIQNLEALPSVCKDYESLSKALLSNTASYHKPLCTYPLLLLDMPLLAATLYNLHTMADSKGIIFHFDICSQHIESKAPEYELSDFISILIHNTLEACMEGDHVYIQLNSSNHNLHFEIRNPVLVDFNTHEVSLFFQKGYTTKPDKASHEYGLYYLANKIKKYDGSVGAECISFEGKNWVLFHFDV